MEPLWRRIAQVDVPAKPDGLWTKAIDYVGPSRSLRFKASGKWTWMDTGSTTTPRECGPDGDLAAKAVEAALSAEALTGALIGRIGGSSGSVRNVATFVVGSEAVIEIDEKTRGPLYLTINDSPAGFAGHDGAIKVTIWESF